MYRYFLVHYEWGDFLYRMKEDVIDNKTYDFNWKLWRLTNHKSLKEIKERLDFVSIREVVVEEVALMI